MITELLYFYILDMTRDFLCSRGFKRIQISVLRYKLIKWLCGPKRLWRFRETGPTAGPYVSLHPGAFQ